MYIMSFYVRKCQFLGFLQIKAPINIRISRSRRFLLKLKYQLFICYKTVLWCGLPSHISFIFERITFEQFLVQCTMLWIWKRPLLQTPKHSAVFIWRQKRRPRSRSTRLCWRPWDVVWKRKRLCWRPWRTPYENESVLAFLILHSIKFP